MCYKLESQNLSERQNNILKTNTKQSVKLKGAKLLQ